MQLKVGKNFQKILNPLFAGIFQHFILLATLQEEIERALVAMDKKVNDQMNQ